MGSLARLVTTTWALERTRWRSSSSPRTEGRCWDAMQGNIKYTWIRCRTAWTIASKKTWRRIGETINRWKVSHNWYAFSFSKYNRKLIYLQAGAPWTIRLFCKTHCWRNEKQRKKKKREKSRSDSATWIGQFRDTSTQTRSGDRSAPRRAVKR